MYFSAIVVSSSSATVTMWMESRVSAPTGDAVRARQPLDRALATRRRALRLPRRRHGVHGAHGRQPRRCGQLRFCEDASQLVQQVQNLHKAVAHVREEAQAVPRAVRHAHRLAHTGHAGGPVEAGAGQGGAVPHAKGAGAGASVLTAPLARLTSRIRLF